MAMIMNPRGARVAHSIGRRSATILLLPVQIGNALQTLARRLCVCDVRVCCAVQSNDELTAVTMPALASVGGYVDIAARPP